MARKASSTVKSASTGSGATATLEGKAPAASVATKIARPASPIAVSSTPVRNTAIPKAAPAARREMKKLSHDVIARRAYEIYISGAGGSQDDNWRRAEQELRSL